MADIKDLLNIFNLSSNLPKEVGHTIAKHESNLGNITSYEPIGQTQGVFHITKGAAETVMTDEEKEDVKNLTPSEFAQLLNNNPEIDADLSGRFAKKQFKRLGANRDALNENEKAAVISNLYNYGNQPSLIRSVKEYANKKREYKNPTEEQSQELRQLSENVKSKMNITTAGGQFSQGLANRRSKEKKQFSTLPEGARSLLESGSTGLVGKILDVDEFGSVSIKDRPGSLEDIVDPQEPSSKAIDMIIDSMGSKEERDYIVNYFGEDKARRYAEQGILEDRIIKGVMMNRKKYGSMEAAVKEIEHRNFLERLNMSTKKEKK